MTKHRLEKFEQYRGYLYDLLNNRLLESNAGFDDTDKHTAFCVAQDALQDTNTGIFAILEQDNTGRKDLAYVEFWGVLQTIFIQQDALNEMYWSLTGIEISEKTPLTGVTDHTDWTTIRNQRNRYCGHLVKSEFKKKGPNFNCKTRIESIVGTRDNLFW
ncbi:hypothetical protein [Parasphingorhabdus halotolerans]|uniref:Uncharacterized protein n=1 Tax=Parasphingorhabdus halotolerans TaxID=2725558 RepID=A0A6H2DP31_9SPHN|nr:hypothetical protein [Parasphingorhabdus halotolerans]QJB70104.1 hypothetical protein HF685_13070 [Parasphingorhabdus halotolerans]